MNCQSNAFGVRSWFIQRIAGGVFLTVACCRVMASAGDPRIITLAEAVNTALERNGSVVSADEDVESANRSIRDARSAFHPQLTPTVFGSLGQTNVRNQSYGVNMSQRLGSGTELRATVGAITAQNQFGRFYSTETTLLISQPLLRRSSDPAFQVDVAESRLRSAERQRAATRQRTVIDVATSYFRIATGKQLLDAATKTLEHARLLLDISQAKLTVGKVSRLDVLRAQQLAGSAELRLVAARANLEDAKDQLRTLLRLPDAEAFDVSIPAMPAPNDTVTEDSAIAAAYANRGEVKDAQEAIALSRHTLAFAGKQLLPQLDLDFGVSRVGAAATLKSALAGDGFRPVTFVSASWPLDRTARQSALQAAATEVNRRSRDLDDVKRRVRQEARRMVRQYQSALAEYGIASSSVLLADAEVDLARTRFDRGLSNNLDLVNAELGLLTAHAQQIELAASVGISRLQLRAATGLLDFKRDVE
jgi:outer membrane protein